MFEKPRKFLAEETEKVLDTLHNGRPQPDVKEWRELQGGTWFLVPIIESGNKRTVWKSSKDVGDISDNRTVQEIERYD